ncbi:MAG TPA: RNA polymerase sigma factor [Vicinamibacterales bacterium]|nr:RNA polymerase sigma factor [Vicinamibacterales bacterium]
MNAAEAELIERCRRREPGAFEQLYREHAPRVYNLTSRVCGSLSEGEDLTQEVFMQVYRKLDSFRGDAALGTWIYRLATNLCLDHLRRRRVPGRETESLDDAVMPAASTKPLNMDAMDLERAIARLPDGYRAAFVLHDVEGFQHHEIAAILGIAEGTSKSQVHKARLKLREYLTRTPRLAVGAGRETVRGSDRP